MLSTQSTIWGLKTKIGALQLRVETIEIKAHESKCALDKMKQEAKECLRAKNEEVKGLQVSLSEQQRRGSKRVSRRLNFSGRKLERLAM